jgi:hypothetical protein
VGRRDEHVGDCLRHREGRCPIGCRRVSSSVCVRVVINIFISQ